LRIVFLTSSLGSGGAERVASTLCNAWSERGDRVTLVPTFSGGGQPFYELSENVELIFLADVVGIKRKNVWSYAQRLAALRRLIVERSPDVIVSFLSNVNVAAVVSSAFLRIPVIICERNDPAGRLQTGALAVLCKLTYRFADMLTVQTESGINRVADIYPGLNRLRSVPNPLPAAIADIRAKHDSHRKILLSLGRLMPQKQVDKLLRAFSEVAPHFPDWDLHIYGDGPLKPALEKQIQELGLVARAYLKGSTNAPWDIMARADVFAMTSKFEGFPNALLEAMGIGLPCVVFDCPSGPREISQNGNDALLVPLDDHEGLVLALRRLMENEELRCLLGEQARASVFKRFGLPEVVSRWDHLFKEVGAIQ